MVSWGWLIVAFFLGDMMGIIAMAICVGSADRTEQEAEKKEPPARQR